MQRQHAVAAKAAAAVQLPVVYASPLGPVVGRWEARLPPGGMNTASEAARAATAAQNALNVGNNNLIRNNFGISGQYKCNKAASPRAAKLPRRWAYLNPCRDNPPRVVSVGLVTPVGGDQVSLAATQRA